jgi:NADPH2:quinone reductase
VFWGDFLRREPAGFAASVAQLGKWYAEGKLRPHISATFPLAQGGDAIKMLAARKVVGKVVLLP